MSIAFDVESQGTQGGTTDLTIPHTVTGANPFLYAFVESDSNATNFTATYNGVSLTLIESQTDGAGNQIYSFYLAAPPTGTHNLVFGKGGISRAARGFGMSYTGVSQTSPIDSHSKKTAATGATFSIPTTVVGSNCWIAAGINNDSLGSPPTVDTGTTQRGTAVGNAIAGDSNGTVGTGSQSLNFAATNGRPWMGVIISIAPATASVNSNFLAFF